MRGTGVQAGVRVWRHCRRRPRAPAGRARGGLRLITGTAQAGSAAEAALQPGRGTQRPGFGRGDLGRGSEVGTAAAAAGPRRLGLVLPWQRLREGPGAAGAPRSGPGSRPGCLSCCHSFLDFSSAVFRSGSPASEGVAGIRSPSPGQSFLAAGALRLGKGNFQRAWSPALPSAKPTATGSSGVAAALSGL